MNKNNDHTVSWTHDVNLCVKYCFVVAIELILVVLLMLAFKETKFCRIPVTVSCSSTFLHPTVAVVTAYKCTRRGW